MKLLLILLISIPLLSFTCKKERIQPNVPGVQVDMLYEIDVVEQDNVSHYVIQVSKDSKEWTDVATILAGPNIFTMEYNYSILVNVSRFYAKDTRFYQRTIAVDFDGKYQISKITSIYFE